MRLDQEYQSNRSLGNHILSKFFYGLELSNIINVLKELGLYDDIYNFKPLQGGYSTRVFQFYSKGQHYVLRILPKRTTDKYEFLNEISASVENSKIKIAPKIFYNDIKNGIILMEYIDNEISIQDLMVTKPVVTINKLAQIIKKSHSQINLKNLKKNCIYERINTTKSHLPQKELTPSLKELLVELMNFDKGVYELLCPCHNDLNPNNILLDSNEKIKLIDWEMSGLNDPFYDLATISNLLIFDESLQFEFLKVYLGREPNHSEISRFVKMKVLSHTFYGTILQVISNDQIFWHVDILDAKIPTLQFLHEQKKIWTSEQFHHPQELSIFGMSMLKEAYYLNLKYKA